MIRRSCVGRSGRSVQDPGGLEGAGGPGQSARGSSCASASCGAPHDDAPLAVTMTCRLSAHDVGGEAYQRLRRCQGTATVGNPRTDHFHASVPLGASMTSVRRPRAVDFHATRRRDRLVSAVVQSAPSGHRQYRNRRQATRSPLDRFGKIRAGRIRADMSLLWRRNGANGIILAAEAMGTWKIG